MTEPQHIAPTFAREAAQYLQDDNIRRALELCIRGTREYPKYATGYLILGNCYSSLNRHVDALVEYKHALAMLPDNATLLALVQKAEENRQHEFEKYAQEQKRKRGEQLAPITLGEFLGEKHNLPQAELPAAAKPAEETAIEHLAKKLKNVQRIRPNPDSEASHAHTPDNDASRVAFATATMADILIAKGEYAEAITIYRELLKKHPENEERFRTKIAEMEDLLALKQGKEGSDGAKKTKAS